MANNFPKLNFTQFMNRNVKILSRRLYSPSLQDVARLERAQLILLIFHSFVCKFGRVEGVAREKRTDKCKKIRKLTERLLSNLHSSNLVNTIIYLVF